MDHDLVDPVGANERMHQRQPVLDDNLLFAQRIECRVVIVNFRRRVRRWGGSNRLEVIKIHLDRRTLLRHFIDAFDADP